MSKLNSSGHKLEPFQRDAVAKLYSEGRSIASLVKEFGICEKSVKQLMRSRGVHIRPHVQIPKKIRKHPKSLKPVHERWATKQVELAERRGEIVRAGACSECFRVGKVHAHHDDYNFPLAVRWLCPKCHKTWHSLNIPVPSDPAVI